LDTSIDGFNGFFFDFEAVFGSSATATFPARGGRSLANAGMQQMTPRAPNAQASITTKGYWV